MKNINFIQAASPRQQRAVRKWFMYSAGSLVVVLTIVLVQLGSQLARLYHVNAQIADYQAHQAAHEKMQHRAQALEKEITQLHDQLGALTQAKESARVMAQVLTAVFEALGSGLLHEFASGPAGNKLVFYAATPEFAQQKADVIGALPFFKTVQLTALQPTTVSGKIMAVMTSASDTQENGKTVELE